MGFLARGDKDAWCTKVMMAKTGCHVLQVKPAWGSGYFVPMKVRGDGNCFVHAASVAMYGKHVHEGHQRE